MSKFSKVGLLIAVMAFCGLAASSAGAVEWHTNGPLAFSSTNAGASRLIIHPAGTVVSCSTSSGSGTLNGPTSTLVPWLSAATVTPAFSGCTVSGAAGYVVACSSAELRANSYSGGTTIGTAGGGTTSGSVTGVDCRLSLGTTTCSTITGSVPAQYINPNPIGTGAGKLTISATGQTLNVTKIGSGCAAVPNGTGTFGSTGPGSSVTDLTYTVDGSNAPYIYQTP
ncbi:hypothetical protein [Baekduia sp.]|jgi:hypothetical protein|uniref:hypothetical protein n=1 Tax=Baekduia sp. TaxID=2600305 RepID=UPI002DFD7948|nr:hypothetical protein [Baekduia sp.]